MQTEFKRIERRSFITRLFDALFAFIKRFRKPAITNEQAMLIHAIKSTNNAGSVFNKNRSSNYLKKDNDNQA